MKTDSYLLILRFSYSNESSDNTTEVVLWWSRASVFTACSKLCCHMSENKGVHCSDCLCFSCCIFWSLQSELHYLHVSGVGGKSSPHLSSHHRARVRTHLQDQLKSKSMNVAGSQWTSMMDDVSLWEDSRKVFLIPSSIHPLLLMFVRVIVSWSLSQLT